MRFGEYCKNLHGMTETQVFDFFYHERENDIRHICIADLLKLSAITGMSVSEHVDELATLIKQENAITF